MPLFFNENREIRGNHSSSQTPAPKPRCQRHSSCFGKKASLRNGRSDPWPGSAIYRLWDVMEVYQTLSTKARLLLINTNSMGAAQWCTQRLVDMGCSVTMWWVGQWYQTAFANCKITPLQHLTLPKTIAHSLRFSFFLSSWGKRNVVLLLFIAVSPESRNVPCSD